MMPDQYCTVQLRVWMRRTDVARAADPHVVEVGPEGVVVRVHLAVRLERCECRLVAHRWLTCGAHVAPHAVTVC